MKLKALVLAAAVILALAVPTAAVTGNQDDAGAITMSPHSGPNGQYATVDDGELEVEFDRLNEEAVTTAHNVFNITNTADCAAEVWVEIEGVTAYRSDDTDNRVDSDSTAAVLSPNETLQVGLSIDTHGSNPSPGSMTVHANETDACSESSDGGDGGDGGGDGGGGSDDGGSSEGTEGGSGDGEPEFETNVSVKNGSDPGEKVITVEVTNNGTGEGTYIAEPEANGTAIGAKVVSVPPGETRKVEFTYQFTKPGTYIVNVGEATTMVKVQMAAGSAPAFEVVELEPAADEVTVGERVEVVATIENSGSADGTYTAVLTDDGTVVAQQDVAVPAGERREVRFTVSFDDPGDHELRVGDASATVSVTQGDIRVVNATVADRRIAPGNATTISATLENTGDTDGERLVELEVGGVVVDSRTVEVPAGETRTVTFERTFETPGVYPVVVGGTDAGEIVVSAGDTTTNRLLTSGLGLMVGIPLVLGLLLALRRRDSLATIARGMT